MRRTTRSCCWDDDNGVNDAADGAEKRENVDGRLARWVGSPCERWLLLSPHDIVVWWWDIMRTEILLCNGLICERKREARFVTKQCPSLVVNNDGTIGIARIEKTFWTCDSSTSSATKKGEAQRIRNAKQCLREREREREIAKKERNVAVPLPHYKHRVLTSSEMCFPY